MSDHSSLNHFAVAYGHGGLVIGSGVRIGAHTTIIPFNHIPGDDAQPLYQKGITAKGITISDYAWIGAGVRVLDGVEIGAHAIVGAGSVVNRNVDAGVTVAGVPARPLNGGGSRSGLTAQGWSGFPGKDHGQ
jgi:acetyltransferase-like isoleucine patch superfamily enzyme